ncbi:unnamed protein product [Angiostrongylus costaricensis]|uniref:Hexosyltransferase n=1 Tax=Angiostrongylus costaricensis TaxID=334426 RepID=A0A158PFJ8_ANGCS|nr:unnamed protein product [Angiostrongylus costaricensis]
MILKNGPVKPVQGYYKFLGVVAAFVVVVVAVGVVGRWVTFRRFRLPRSLDVFCLAVAFGLTTAMKSKAYFRSSLFVLASLFIARYFFALKTRILLPLKLGEAPSVILAPPSGFCNSRRYLVILITRVQEPEKRRRFMTTYGRFSELHNFTVLFPVGLSKDEEVNSALGREHEAHANILQTNFVDSYRNLTLKSYSWANYVRKNCTSVKAVLKIDDDVALNVKEVFKYLDDIDPNGNILYCNPVKRVAVEREKRNMWYVSFEQYPHEFYPEYCLSPIYAGTPGTFAKLYNATTAVNHFWIDDVFSTGVVGLEAGVSFRWMPISKNFSNFQSFFNGSAVAQYVKEMDVAWALFVAMNIDPTRILE